MRLVFACLRARLMTFQPKSLKRRNHESVHSTLRSCCVTGSWKVIGASMRFSPAVRGTHLVNRYNMHCSHEGADHRLALSLGEPCKRQVSTSTNLSCLYAHSFIQCKKTVRLL